LKTFQSYIKEKNSKFDIKEVEKLNKELRNENIKNILIVSGVILVIIEFLILIIWR
jgi:hypothetical protein